MASQREHGPAADDRAPRVTAGRVAVGVFTGCYLAVAGTAVVAVGNREFLFYIAVMLVLVAVVTVVHWRVGLSTGVLLGLSAWGLLHMAGGLVPVPAHWPIHGEIRVLYSLWLVPGWLKYDQVVHAYGFGVTTVVCWEALRAAIATRESRPVDAVRPSFGLLVLCTAAGMGFGALNEVVEFIATLLVPETNVGGYDNTGWDLVANAVGTAVAAGLIALASRRGDV